MGIKSDSLQSTLMTSASSPDFIPALDSYLYDNNVVKVPNKSKFFIQTVDYNGIPYTYNINGFNIVGVVLSINPNSVNVNAAKIINRTQTMSGWLEEHWGEELDSVTFQGSSAAFIWDGPSQNGQIAEQIRGSFNDFVEAKDLKSIYNGDVSGLAVARRKETASYDEFRQLMQLMNANAASFDIYGLVKDRLYIQITYDYASYLGYFESFDLTENAETPFKYIYTITFKSEKTLYTYRSPVTREVSPLRIPAPEPITFTVKEATTPAPLVESQSDSAIIASIAFAIGQYETAGGNPNFNSRQYTLEGPVITDPTSPYYGERAVGRYQIMPGNIPSWSKEALGKTYTVEEIKQSPELQDKIALFQMKKSYEKTKSTDDTISIWFSGKPAKGNTASDGYQNVPGYIQGVVPNMDSNKPGSPGYLEIE